MSGLAVGTTCTSPPCSRAFNPFSASQARRATSCVLPSWGEAIFLPAKSAGEVMPLSGWTISNAPPLVEPLMMRRASPPDCT